MEGGYLSNFQNPSLDILGYLFENSFLHCTDKMQEKNQMLNKVKVKLKIGLWSKDVLLQYSVDWSLRIKLISSLWEPKLSENTILNVIWLPVLFHFIKIKKIKKTFIEIFKTLFIAFMIKENNMNWIGWLVLVRTIGMHCSPLQIIVSFCLLGIKPYLDDKERWNIHLNCICGTRVNHGHNMHCLELFMSCKKMMKVRLILHFFWNTFGLDEKLYHLYKTVSFL